MPLPRIPHTVAASWPEAKPGRFAATARVLDPSQAQIALLGLPDDLGVKLNGGRPGAAAGPSAFRAALVSFGTAWDGTKRRAITAKFFDAGDIVPATIGPSGEEAALLATHKRIEEALTAIHALGLFPVCIGGGHDLTLPAITALAKHLGEKVGGINFDAHLDVRERIGSGMAFRRLIEGGAIDDGRFLEAGLGRFANDEADYRWLERLRARTVTSDDIMSSMSRDGLDYDMIAGDWLYVAAPDASDACFVSIDLDALDVAFAPGVSAANPSGLTVHHAARLASLAGANARVKYFDIMELSPPHDQDHRTARIAALLFLSFVAGWEGRK